MRNCVHICNSIHVSECSVEKLFTCTGILFPIGVLHLTYTKRILGINS